jgi:hypothetical protein
MSDYPSDGATNVEIATLVLISFLVVHKIFKLSFKTYYANKIKRANDEVENVPV